MIELKQLTKKYDQKTALKQLNLTIKEGIIFGFLGHNGAGKSTTIKSLVSVIEPTEGTILFDQKQLDQNRNMIKKQIAYVPDTPDMFLQLSASEYWDFIAAVYQIDPAQRKERQAELVQLFEMNDQEQTLLENFSHGMRQKTIIIGALLPDPDIWILDEPLQGLDPQAAYDLKEKMKQHAQKGKTVIFSTHDLATAQQLCDELAILKNGSLLYHGTVNHLLDQYEGKSLEDIYLQITGKHADEPMTAPHQEESDDK